MSSKAAPSYTACPFVLLSFNVLFFMRVFSYDLLQYYYVQKLMKLPRAGTGTCPYDSPAIINHSLWLGDLLDSFALFRFISYTFTGY